MIMEDEKEQLINTYISKQLHVAKIASTVNVQKPTPTIVAFAEQFAKRFGNIFQMPSTGNSSEKVTRVFLIIRRHAPN